ncbi:uncharacterized protein LOC128243929 [Mya arenaria]|uniref:uncharacterized protein LOC128243929 n=1 Tax=Mya arenaria TaxID=6604 RepID=UPI0022DF4D2A|nr:uncharacterized protein LOC128243929 [Mya arenaria]
MSEVASSEQSRDVQYEFDVFLCHSGIDENITRQIHKSLTSQGLKCAAQFDSTTFPTGRPVLASIGWLVQNSRKTIVVLTRNALESSWISVETILALENSQERREQDLTLRLLLIDIDKRDVPMLKCGLLASIPHTATSLKRHNWDRDVINSLRTRISVSKFLPVGSLAHAMVFSHFTGLMFYMIKRLKSEIETKSAIYKENKGLFSLKYNMLLPSSCKTLGNLKGVDEATGITIETGEILNFKEEHMGKTRDFNITIYKIFKGNEYYYFYADMPNSLNCIHQLKSLQLAEGVDPRLQIERFRYTYENLVNHVGFTVRDHSTLKVLPYDDCATTHFQILFDAVREQVMDHKDSDLKENKQMQETSLKATSSRGEKSAENEDVLVLCTDHHDDIEIANQIRGYLESRNIRVEFQAANKSNLISKTYNWYVFVFSQDALHDDLLTFNCLSALNSSVSDNVVKVLPVLHNVDVNKVPSFIRWVTVLTTSDDREKYCNNIYQTVTGGVVQMEERMPCGDVATGLCWAYIINYLRHTLYNKDFKGRIQRFLEEKNMNCGFLTKMYIWWPRSCKAADSVVDGANIGAGEGSQAPVKKIDSLPEVIVDQGAQQKKPFILNVFQYTRPADGKIFCFVSEYCAAMGCLYQMAKNFAFAGISTEEMYRQGKVFVDKFVEISSRQAVKDQFGDFNECAKVVYYDDSKTNLLAAIENEIRQAEVDGSVLY